jgi:hypothetical protein
MNITEAFRNGQGEIHAQVIDFDGVPVLAKRGRRGEIRLEMWGPDPDASWSKLLELERKELVDYVYSGLSIAQDDHWKWRGEPIPGLA